MKPAATAFSECQSLYRCRKSSPHRTLKLSSWLVACTVGLLLAVLCLDPVSSTTASISCTYASSCNDQCSSVCPHGKFTPLLPSTCSPEGQTLQFSSDSRPNSTSPSLNLTSSIEAPLNTVPNSFTLVFWIKPTSLNGVIVHLESSMMSTCTISLNNGLICIRANENAETCTNLRVTLSPPSWNHLAIVFTNTSNFMMDNVTLYLNASQSQGINLMSVISEHTSIYIGGSKIDASAFFEDEYEGLMQDVGLIDRALSRTSVDTLFNGAVSLSGASFLPQCLCPINEFVVLPSTNQQECSNRSNRFLNSSHVPEFVADGLLSTSWLSNATSSVQFIVGLTSATSLSKVFVYFVNDLPPAAELQYKRDGENVWRTLQRYSTNCSLYFNTSASDSLNDNEFVCEDINDFSGTTLSFYISANGRNTSNTTQLMTTFKATQVQILMNGGDQYSISEVEICQQFILGTEQSCDNITSQPSSSTIVEVAISTTAVTTQTTTAFDSIDTVIDSSTTAFDSIDSSTTVIDSSTAAIDSSTTVIDSSTTVIDSSTAAMDSSTAVIEPSPTAIEPTATSDLESSEDELFESDIDESIEPTATSDDSDDATATIEASDDEEDETSLLIPSSTGENTAAVETATTNDINPTPVIATDTSDLDDVTSEFEFVTTETSEIQPSPSPTDTDPDDTAELDSTDFEVEPTETDEIEPSSEIEESFESSTISDAVSSTTTDAVSSTAIVSSTDNLLVPSSTEAGTITTVVSSTSDLSPASVVESTESPIDEPTETVDLDMETTDFVTDTEIEPSETELSPSATDDEEIDMTTELIEISPSSVIDTVDASEEVSSVDEEEVDETSEVAVQETSAISNFEIVSTTAVSQISVTPTPSPTSEEVIEPTSIEDEEFEDTVTTELLMPSPSTTEEEPDESEITESTDDDVLTFMLSSTSSSSDFLMPSSSEEFDDESTAFPETTDLFSLEPEPTDDDFSGESTIDFSDEVEMTSIDEDEFTSTFMLTTSDIQAPSTTISAQSTTLVINTANVTSSVVFASSTVFLTSSVTPTPTSTIAVEPSVTPSSSVVFPSVTVTPTVEINGVGILLEAADETANTTLMFDFTVGLFGVKAVEEDEGIATVTLGSRTATLNYSRAIQKWESFEAKVSTASLYSDMRNFTLALQVHDQFDSTRVLPVTFDVLVSHLSGNITGNCSIVETSQSGTCFSTLSVPEDWFTSSESSVTVSIRDQNEANSSLEFNHVANITLQPIQSSTNNELNTLYLTLPQAPLYAGLSSTLDVMARFPFTVFGFGIDCTVTGASINETISPIIFSDLFSFFEGTDNRIAFSGFRNREQFDAASTGDEPEKLASIVFTPSGSSENFSIGCKATALSLTNRQIIATARNPISFSIPLPRPVQEITLVAIFPYTANTILLNLATVNRSTQHVGRVNAMALFSDGSYRQLNSSDLVCSSYNDQIVNVTQDCLSLFFTGEERMGAEEIDIRVAIAQSTTEANLTLSIWHTSTISISLTDNVLNLTNQDCDDEIEQYQQTEVTIEGIISNGQTYQSVILTSLLRHLLDSSNDSVAIVDEEGFVIGQSTGSAEIFISNGGETIATTSVSVSDDPASPVYLSILVFSDLELSLQTTRLTPEEAVTGIITVREDFDYDDTFISVLLVFEDGQTLDVTNSSRLNLTLGDSQTDDNIFRIPSGVTSLDIAGSWSVCSDMEATGQTNITIETGAPQRVQITSSTPILVVNSTDPLYTFYQHDTAAALTVLLVYQDSRFNQDISAQADLNITTSDASVVTVAVNSSGAYVNAIGTGTANIIVTTQDNSTDFVEIRVIQSLQLTPILYSYLPTPLNISDRQQLSSLRRISSTNIYQQAIAEATLFLSNGSFINATSFASFSITSSNTNYVEILDRIVRVSNTSQITEGEIISVTANLNQLTNTANITINASSLTVTEATVQFVDLFSGTSGSVIVADCSVTFEDDTRLLSTFDENGVPLYDSLVSFSTSDSSIASVVSASSNVTLHANSREQLDLMCNASNVIASRGFFCNLIASEREVDLGNNVERPLDPAPPNSLVNISLYLTSNDYSVGVFEVSVMYEPDKVAFVSANQGMDWLRGTLVVAETRNNTIIVGGVLNNGVRGTQQEIGMLQFAVNGQTGVTEFTALPTLFATADLNLTDILEPVTPSVVQLQITDSVQRRSVPAAESESTSSHRVRRQTVSDVCTGPYPAGDINGDCDVDLRDSYYFQEYIQAEVHNFTGSSNGEAIQENIDSKNITLDVDGDGIISLVDIVTVEQVGSGLVYELDINSPYVNRQLCNCVFNFNGTVSLANGAAAPTENLHVFLHLAHSDGSLLTELDNLNLTNGRLVAMNSSSGIHSALIQTEVQSMNNQTMYQVNGIANLSLSNIGLSVVQVVTDFDGRIEPSRVAGLFGEEQLVNNNSYTLTVLLSDGQMAELQLPDGLKPHTILNISCPESSPSREPRIPLSFDTSGASAFVSNIVEENNFQYSLELTTLASSNAGQLSVQLGNTTRSISYETPLTEATSPVIQGVASFDQAAMRVTGTAQVFTMDGIPFNKSQHVIEMTVSAGMNTATTNCTPNFESGICQFEYNISDNFVALNVEMLNVSFSLAGAPSSTVQALQATYYHRLTQTITNSIAVELPAYTLLPGSEFEIKVTSNSTYSLISFLLAITLPQEVELVSYVASEPWGVQCTDALRCIGYASSFQTADVTASGQPQVLFRLNVRVSDNISNGELPVAVELHELFDIFYENVMLLPSSTVPIVIGRAANAHNAFLHIGENQALELFAYATNTELVNMAVFDNQQIEVPILAQTVYTNGSLVDVATSISCRVASGEEAISVTLDCTAVLNGTEEMGTSQADILVSFAGINTSVYFRVWYPQLPVTLTLASNQLYAIQGAGACETGFQSSSIAATTNFSTDSSNTINDVDVTSSILQLLTISNTSVLAIDAQTVRGLSPGTATLLVENKPDLVENVTVTVFEEAMSVEYLYTIIVTNIDIQEGARTGQTLTLNVSIYQDFSHHNATGEVIIVAMFSNGIDMVLTYDDAVMIETLDTALVLNEGRMVTAASNTTGDIVRASWTSTCSSPSTCIRQGVVSRSVFIPEPSGLVLVTSPPSAIISNTAILDIPTAYTVSVFLQYPNSRRDVTADTTIQGASYSFASGEISIMPSTSGNVTVNFTYVFDSSLTFSNQVSLTVVGIETITLATSTGSLDTVIYRIGNTSAYEPLSLTGTVRISDGTELDLLSLSPSLYRISTTSSEYLTVSNDSLIVQAVPQSSGITVISVSIGQVTSNNITIMIDSTLSAARINSLMLITSIDAMPDQALPLDFQASLVDGTMITSLRTLVNSEISQLISISTTDSSVISVTDNLEIVLRRASPCPVDITASVIGGSTTTTFSVFPNLNPQLGGVDLGRENGKSLPVVEPLSTFAVPVFINTEDSGVNKLDISVVYNDSFLLIENVTTAGASDWSGGMFFYHTTSSVSGVSTVRFGGVTLGTELQGQRVHVANIHFTAQGEGTIQMYAYAEHLSNSSAELTPSDASVFYLTVSANNETCPAVIFDLPSPSLNSLSCLDNSLVPCPVDLPLSSNIISDILNASSGFDDLNLDGDKNTLDPLFASQVNFGLLSFLYDLPELVNSTRDEIRNSCQISIMVDLAQRNGEPTRDTETSVYILLDISDLDMDSFNFTSSLDVSDSILIPALLNLTTDSYNAVFETTLEEIPAGSLGVSLIQFTNTVSPAQVLFMAMANNGTDSLDLRMEAPLPAVYKQLGYRPLLFNADIQCPPLEIEPSSTPIPSSTLAPSSTLVPSSTMIVSSTLAPSSTLIPSSTIAPSSTMAAPSSTVFNISTSSVAEFVTPSATFNSSSILSTTFEVVSVNLTTDFISTTSVEISSTPVEVSTTPVEISTTPAEVSTTPVEVSTTPVEVSTTPVEVSTTPVEVNISTTPVEVSTTPVEISTTPVEVSTTQVEVSTTLIEVNISTTPVVVSTTPVEVSTTPVEVSTTPVEVSTTPVEVSTTTPVEISSTPVLNTSSILTLISTTPVFIMSSSTVEVQVTTSLMVSITPNLTETSEVATSSEFSVALTSESVTTEMTTIAESSSSVVISSTPVIISTSTVVFSPTPTPTPLSIDDSRTMRSSTEVTVFIATSELINENEYTLKRESCSLLKFITCESSYVEHTNWSIMNDMNNNEARLTIQGLDPYSSHNFIFSGQQNLTFQVNTSAATPEGFDANKITITSTLTSLTVSWDSPDMLNGPLENVTITATSVSRRKRSTGLVTNSSTDVSGSVTLNNLAIGTSYTVTVTVFNSEGSVTSSRSQSTASPNAAINISDANGCISVSITHEHLNDLMTLNATSQLNFTCNDGNSAQLNLDSLTNSDHMFCSDNITVGDMSLGEIIGGCPMYSVAVSVSINGESYVSEIVQGNGKVPFERPSSSTPVPVSTTPVQQVSTTIVPSSSLTIEPSSESVPSSDSITPIVSSTIPLHSSTVQAPITRTSSSPLLVTSMILPTSSAPSIGTANQVDYIPIAIGVVFGIVFILVIIAVIMVAVICVKMRRKSRGTAEFYMYPNSTASKDYFCTLEENVEMSPIDIVPVEHMMYDDPYMETSLNNGVIVNRAAISMSDGQSREASLSSVKPLLAKIPPPRGTGRVTFEESEALPSYHTETQMKNTDYEDDSESLIDLNFHEDMISQPYLSLGLTPLSQLSPDPVNSMGGDFGFFPSMLPPVSAAIPTVMNGPMPVNDSAQMEMDSLVMPDAMPPANYGASEQRRASRRERNVRGEGMNRAFSNGRLEPVAEQSSLETDEYSRMTSSSSHDTMLKVCTTTNLMDLKDSSSSYEGDIPSVFPSANHTPPMKGGGGGIYSPNWKNHSKEHYIDEVWSSESPTKPNGSSFTAVPSSYQPDPMYDTREETRYRRQMARQEALALQRERYLVEKKEEEERKLQRQIALQSSFGRQSGAVLQQAALIDAREELSHDSILARVPASHLGMQAPFSPTKFSPKHRSRHANSFDMTEPELTRTTNFTTVL